MLLPIVHYNQSILRKKGTKVSIFDEKLTKLVNDMIETMHAAAGIGLAAQQIGLAEQVCVADLRETDQDFTWELDGAKVPLELFMPMAIINPEITKLESADIVYEEGCLSFPKIRGDVVRRDAIEVKYVDQSGVPHTLRCNGLFARCIQHEADHLNGVLFIDRMQKLVRARVEREVKTLAEETKAAAK